MSRRSQITRRHELRCPKCDEIRQIVALRAAVVGVEEK